MFRDQPGGLPGGRGRAKWESLELVTKEAEGLSCSGMDGVSGGVAWDSVLSWIVFPQIHILPRTSEYDLITQRAGGHVKTEAEIGVW